MKLNVGCGTQPLPGFVNVDRFSGEKVDIVFDAAGPWPFKDGSVEFIHSTHVLEHLPEPFGFMREAWRVLAPSTGETNNLYLRLPYGPSEAGFGDVTHIRYYTSTSFCCFQPGYGVAAHNRQYDDWKGRFRVTSLHLRINAGLRWLLKPLWRGWAIKLLPFLWDGYTEIIVGLEALKTEREAMRWAGKHESNIVPVTQCMYLHEYEGRALRKHESLQWVYFHKWRRQDAVVN